LAIHAHERGLADREVDIGASLLACELQEGVDAVHDRRGA
jgi:hypothetical protein